jgi:N-acetylglucosaminylphosphatidylinositol deacetylase
MIVTFDKFGISSHPNHIAVHKGVAKVFEDPTFPIDVMTLTTVNVVRKYLGYGDIYLNDFNELHYLSLTPYHSYKSMRCHHS